MNRLNPFVKFSMRLRPALSLLCLLCVCLATAPAAQKREHLTPEEIELVRDNQELDSRTGVFIKAAERRLTAVVNPAEAEKSAAKEKEKWGELKGTRVQLIYDISKILEEAVVNVDDVAERTPDSHLPRKSLYMLAQTTAKMLPVLTKLRQDAQNEAEADQLDRALETAQEINDAAKERGVNAEDLKTKPKPAKKND